MRIQSQIQIPKIIEYSQLQIKYIEEACHDDIFLDHRWNIKSGATQCGKTTLDFMYVIPFRIVRRKGQKGAIAITGVSLGTIERNVLEPMREYWIGLGYDKIVGNTKKDSAGNPYVMIFGEKVYLCGMLDKTAISRLRGAKFKYVYCDEISEYNKDAFNLMKSRLSLPYSCMDGACNPESDTHWLYIFINSNIDLYLQNYTIFDNPFLSKKYIDELCKEYSGTVYYDRYILGLWKKAEGLIFSNFANKQKDYIIYNVPRLMKINIGVDFGGNGSKHAFVATGFGFGYSYVVSLESVKLEGTTTPDELEKEFIKFVRIIISKYQSMLPADLRTFSVYCDSAEQVLIRGLKVAAIREKLPVIIKNALKMEIKQRINLQTRLFGQNRLFIMFNAQSCINAYATAVYNSKEGHTDERLDNGTTDIDTLDASEYSIEPEYKNLLNALGSNVRRGLIYD